MTADDHRLTGRQIGALETMAGCPDGCTEAALKVNGFTIGLLGGLIRAGLAATTPGVVKAGDRTLGVVRLTITEKGRTMIVRDALDWMRQFCRPSAPLRPTKSLTPRPPASISARARLVAA
jgi:hypothetical protein